MTRAVTNVLQISQGCAFITRLAKASTEYKGILLKETLQQTDSAAPFATLAGIRDVFLANRRTATLHPRDKLDTDPGPPSTFDYANADLLDPEGTGEVGATTTAEGAIGQVAGAGGAAAPPTGPAGGAEGADSIVPIIVSMTPEDAGIRERAYVLWDMARVKDWNLWEQIEISPREATTTPTRAQYSTMRQLWRAHRDKWAERHGAPWYISLTDEETVRLMNIFKLWGEEALATEPWDNGEEEEWVDE